MLLAVAMILGIMPMSGATEQAATASVAENVLEYDFTPENPKTAALLAARLAELQAAGVSDPGRQKDYSVYDVSIEDGWNWEFNSALSAPALTSSKIRFQSYGLDGSAAANFNTGNPTKAADLTVNISVPTAGRYVVSKLQGYTLTGGAEAGLFVNGTPVGKLSYATAPYCGTLLYSDLGVTGLKGGDCVVELNAGINTVTFRKVSNANGHYIAKIAFTPAEPEPEVTVYNFVNRNDSQDSDDPYKRGTPIANVQIGKDGYNWSFDAGKSAGKFTAIPSTAPKLDTYGINCNFRTDDTSENNRDLTLNILVPAAGTYQVSTLGLSLSAGADTDYYINGTKIGSYSFYSEKQFNPKDAEIIGEYTFDQPGEYDLTIRATNDKLAVYPRNVTLTPAPTAPEKIVYSFKQLPADAFDGRYASGVKFDKVHIGLDGFMWSWNAEKSAQRFATGTYPRFQPYGAQVGFGPNDTDATKFDLTFNIQVPYPGEYYISTGGLATSSGADTDYYINGEKVGSYSFYSSVELNPKPDETIGRYTFPKAGNYELTIRAKEGHGSNIYPGHVTLSPILAQKKIVYDFVGQKIDSSAANYRLKKINAVKIGQEDFNWEMNQSLSSSRFIIGSGNYAPYFEDYGLYVGYVIQDAYTNKSDLAFNIEVPAAGKYSVSVDGYAASSGAKCEFIIDGKSVGQYSFNADKDGLKSAEILGVVEFDMPGTYVMIMRSLESTNKLGFLSHVTLDPVSDAPAQEQIFDFHQSEDKESVKGAGKTALQPTISFANGSNWQINTSKSCSRVAQAPDKSGARFQTYGVIISIDNAVGVPVSCDGVFELDVKGSGYYDIEICGGGYSTGGIAAHYIDGIYIGEYSYYSDVTGGVVHMPVANMRSVYLIEGVHTLTIRTIKQGKSSSNQHPGHVRLTPREDMSAVSEIIPEISSTDPRIGDTITVSGATIKYENGAEVPFMKNINGTMKDEMELTLESSDEDVIAVEGSELKVKGVGETTVKVGLKQGGVDCGVYAEYDFEVLDPTAPLGSIEIVSSRGDKIYRTQSTELSLIGTLESGLVVDMTQAEFSGVEYWTEGGEVTIDGNVATAAATGTAVIKAKATVNGKEQEATLEIEVDFDNLPPLNNEFISFRLKENPNVDGTTPIRDNVSFANGWNWEPIKELSTKRAYNASLNYRFQSFGADASMRGAPNQGHNAADPYSSDLAFRFKISQSGWYEIAHIGGGNPDRGPTDIFIDNNFVGEYDYYNGGYADELREKRMRTIYLEEGVHIIVFRGCRYPPGKENIGMMPAVTYFREVRDDNLPTFDRLVLAADSNYISTDGATTVRGKAKMSSGATVELKPNNNDPNVKVADMPELQVRYWTEDTDIVTVDEKTGDVTPIGEGLATIWAEGSIDGGKTFVKGSCEITVYKNNLEAVTAYVEAAEAYSGLSYPIVVKGTMTDGKNIDTSEFEIEATSDNPEVATVEKVEGVWTINAIKAGVANISVTAKYADFDARELSIKLDVTDTEFEKIVFTPSALYFNSESEPQTFTVSGFLNNGNQVDVEILSVESEDEEIATVTEDGLAVTPIALGKTYINVTASALGKEVSGKMMVLISNGKTKRTIYTEEEIANARENIEKYSWARNMRDTAVKDAERYLDTEYMWNLITTQELPRSIFVGFVGDPNNIYCRYCGVNINLKYSLYGWVCDPINSPWKVQCPDCRRKFPTNDFGSFYKLGIVEPGEEELYGVPSSQWSYEKSHKVHYELNKAEYTERGIESYEKYDEMLKAGERMPGIGFLKNNMYTDLKHVSTLNRGEGLLETETEEAWGVDDGYGYRTGRIFDEKTPERIENHSYIAYYNNFGLYYGGKGSKNNPAVIAAALSTLADAYMYTGDIKYGRVGAILLDRIADIYPYTDGSVHWGAEKWDFGNNHGGGYQGNILGSIEEGNTLMPIIVRAYDALYPAFEDSQVIEFLSDKAERYGLENKKETTSAIRKNIEDGILREIYESACTGAIDGNFGMHQYTVAAAAVALDAMPETGEWIDWCMRYGVAGGKGEKEVTGGSVLNQLVSVVDRDGFGNEEAVGYNTIWLTNMIDLGDVLYGYETYPSADLYNNPKYVKMFTSFINLTLARKYMPALGDGGAVPSTSYGLGMDTMLEAWDKAPNEQIGQTIYMLNGNSVKDLHTSIFRKNPESIKEEISDIIETEGELDMQSNTLLSGFGFAAIRDGSRLVNPVTNDVINTMRDFWINTSVNHTSHCHNDQLNLGMEAYGFNFLPDLGYPEASGDEGNDLEWVDNTISHNTVVVNNKKQNDTNKAGFPLHMDDAGDVKVMDIDSKAYEGLVDEYRRTVVMIRANEEVSYGVDFFRILGGTDHLYSFHAQSSKMDVTHEGEPVEFTEQKENGEWVGTYAGTDVPFGTSGRLDGSSWLDHIRRADNPGINSFVANFKIADYGKKLEGKRDLGLKLTMVNDFEPEELTAAYSYAPRTSSNKTVDHLDHLLVRRTSPDEEVELDTLFSAVIEPYDGEDYIESVEAVELTTEDIPTPGSVARALKVNFKDGRADYVVYSTDNSVTYDVGGIFDFRGIVGVYSVQNGTVGFKYVLDGDIIDGETEAPAAYTGRITSFTEQLSFENKINIKLDSEVENPEDLVGRMVVIENDGAHNAAYEIKGATADGTDLTLDVGDVTFIRSYKDAKDMNAGYVYNIARGQAATIPLSYSESAAPVNVHGDYIFSAATGKKINAAVSAKSTEGGIRYSSNRMPRGASIDAETGVITWTPDENQAGKHGMIVRAENDFGFTSINVIIDVYKSAGSVTDTQPSTPPASDDDKPTTPPAVDDNPSTPSGGGGGGGGGGSSSGGSSDTTEPEDTTKPEDSTDTETEDNAGGGSATVEKFVDLENHDWAKDAIYALVDKGVINGTSANTYSPAKRINRADFAIMLVRAFDVTEGDGEHFADVSANKYYAEELRLAKANGIVGGIGDNKFNPEGEITRQDMMVMLSRALKAVGKELDAADESVLAQFADSAQITDYARDAVAQLIKVGAIAGANGRINPTGRATRAEVAVMLSRVLAK